MGEQVEGPLGAGGRDAHTHMYGSAIHLYYGHDPPLGETEWDG